MSIVDGLAFGRALCEHVGLPPGKVTEVTVHAANNEVFGASVRITLTAADLEAIAARMAGRPVARTLPLETKA